MDGISGSLFCSEELHWEETATIQTPMIMVPSPKEPVPSDRIAYLDDACTKMDTCVACLDNENSCAWINGTCQDDCRNGNTEAACYTEALYPQLGDDQICHLAGDYRSSTDSVDDSDSLEETLPCGNMTNCLSCLDNDNNCVWSAGSCHNSCYEIADASCYSEGNFPEFEEIDICRMAEAEDINSKICDGVTGCEECTSTSMLDGNTCTWHVAEHNSSITWCSSEECDMWDNCGSKTCAVSSASGGIRGGKSQKKPHGPFGWLAFP